MIVHNTLESLKGIKPVVTTGIFDGVHLGHQKLLTLLREEAKKHNTSSLVITFWPHPLVFFKPDDSAFRLLMSLDEKAMKLSELGIDHLLVLPFDKELSSLGAKEFVKQIIVDGLEAPFLVVGDDHRFGKGQEGTYEFLKKLSELYGFGLSELDTLTNGKSRVSSTFVRSCLNAGDLSSANKLLGYNYYILGQVETGNQIGSKIGFPTANIKCCDGRKQIPQDGVYVVSVEWKGALYGGMLNIGTRPTIENTGRKSIEVHMFEHSGNLYDEKLKVSFILKLRDEMRFNGLEELTEQLQTDKENSLRVLKELSIK